MSNQDTAGTPDNRYSSDEDNSQSRHMFRVFATPVGDGKYSGHVSHMIEGEPATNERIYDTGFTGTEQEALDEAHAYVTKFISDHP